MYNPSDPGKKGNIFGFPYKTEDAGLILIPVPHDVTVSYQDGTSRAPGLILKESTQLDLFLKGYQKPWLYKVAYDEPILKMEKNDEMRLKAEKIIEILENNGMVDEQLIQEINDYSARVNQKIYDRAKFWRDQGKIVGVVGGDHSCPLGLLSLLSENYSYGILQIDAHMDLRKAYEGFEFSHASIMYNALQLKNITKLVQIGIRDYCEEEVNLKNNDERVITYLDEDLFHKLYHNDTWYELCEEIVDHLPGKIYISFDVDGLDPALCPNTGTPVPGGLNFNQVIVLINTIARSGKKIIGFDLCEAGGHPWDANVASRILYRLCVATALGNKL